MRPEQLGEIQIRKPQNTQTIFPSPQPIYSDRAWKMSASQLGSERFIAIQLVTASGRHRHNDSTISVALLHSCGAFVRSADESLIAEHFFLRVSAPLNYKHARDALFKWRAVSRPRQTLSLSVLALSRTSDCTIANQC